jgi:hypothetical protein
MKVSSMENWLILLSDESICRLALEEKNEEN